MGKDIFFTDMPDPYLKGNHLMVTSEHVARTIEQKAKKVLKMLKRGVKFTPTQPDVLTILEKLKTNK